MLCSVVKWCWSRLAGGVVTWDAYELFRTGEHGMVETEGATSLEHANANVTAQIRTWLETHLQLSFLSVLIRMHEQRLYSISLIFWRPSRPMENQMVWEAGNCQDWQAGGRSNMQTLARVSMEVIRVGQRAYNSFPLRWLSSNCSIVLRMQQAISSSHISGR